MKKLLRYISHRIGKYPGLPDSFLRSVTGVVHVGGNVGQERQLYATFNLDVIWVEPIPECFETLRSNLAEFPTQRAYQYLITDHDEREYIFHISNNGGASSSILPLAKHREMWPDVVYADGITLHSITFKSFIERERLSLSKYQALVLDTQGTELMILKGAGGLLPEFRFIKVEAPDFESYEGCCTANELRQFMEAQGFREKRRDVFRSLPGTGTYYDLLFERSDG